MFVLFVTLALLMAACTESSNSNTHGNANVGNANSSAASNAVSSGDRDFMTKAAIGGMEEVELGRVFRGEETGQPVVAGIVDGQACLRAGDILALGQKEVERRRSISSTRLMWINYRSCQARPLTASTWA